MTDPALPGPEESVRLTAWVHGRVQGVGYRWWVRSRALELALVGWARNLPDGRVEVVAEGPARACALLLAVLRDGSGPGQVSKVVERMSAAGGGLGGTGVLSGFTER